MSEDKPPVKVSIVFNRSQKLIPNGGEIIPGQPWATREEASHIKPRKAASEPKKSWWKKILGKLPWFG